MMIEDNEARAMIAKKIGEALDDLVRKRMEGLVGEPDITSRIGQRLEDRFDGKTISGYGVRVITETITSLGKRSLEKPMGVDLYFAFHVDTPSGASVSKGVFIQAKRKEHCDWSKLAKQCKSMNLITKKGSVAWLYDIDGITAIHAKDPVTPHSNKFSATIFFDRVLECEIGDKRKVPAGKFGDRRKLKAMLEAVGARNAISLGLAWRETSTPSR